MTKKITEFVVARPNKCPVTFTDILCSEFVPMMKIDYDAFAGIEGDGFICTEIKDTERSSGEQAFHDNWIATADVRVDDEHTNIEVSHVGDGSFATWRVKRWPTPGNYRENDEAGKPETTTKEVKRVLVEWPNRIWVTPAALVEWHTQCIAASVISAEKHTENWEKAATDLEAAGVLKLKRG